MKSISHLEEFGINRTDNDSKIRILFIIDILYGVGGTEKQLLELIKRIDKKRFACYVCPFRYTTEMIERVTELGGEVWPAPVKRMYGLSGIHQAGAIIKKIRQHKIDIVSTYHFIADTYGVLISKLAGVPCIISNRRDTGDHQHNKYARLIQWLDRFVERYLAVCTEVSEHIEKHHHIDKGKIKVIYNGIDVESTQKIDRKETERLRQRYHINGKNFVIGNISHVRPEKGYDVFFEAVRRVKDQIPELQVFAVGDGLPEEREMVRRLAREKEVEGKVIFTNYVRNPLDYISLLDVACLTPVRNEGFSNALLEEMTLAKPIVATDVGANAEAIVDGESGFIVPPGDPEALAQAMIKYYRNPQLRRQMGQAALQRVKNNFTLDKTISTLEATYLSLYAKTQNLN
ncbi:MAG: glycosyltransferase [bacterium]